MTHLTVAICSTLSGILFGAGLGHSVMTASGLTLIILSATLAIMRDRP